MDPITLSLLAGGGALAAGLLAYFLRRFRSQRLPKQLPPPSPLQPQSSPSSLPSSSPPSPEPPRLSDEEIIEEATSHIVFTQQLVVVGHEEVGRRVVGHALIGVPYPADVMDVEPIRSLSQLPQLLPAERTASFDLRVIRIVSGEARIAAHYENQPQTVPDLRPILRAERKMLYLLLDVSPSMFPGEKNWAPPLWRGISCSLLQRSIDARAKFLVRCFGGVTTPQRSAENAEEARALRQYLMSVGEIGNTDIAGALSIAMEDFSAEEYDSADIMIITDGESNFDPSALRQQLSAANIRLHAIMFGLQNAELRQCADVYQCIPRLGVIEAPVRQSFS